MSSIFNVTDIYGNLIYQGAGTNPGSAGASSIQVSQIIQNAADIGSTTSALAAHAAVAEVHFLIDDEAEALTKVYSSTYVEALVNAVTNEHRAHADDVLVHFTEASINHANMNNVGTNSHAQIDLYIADADIRFNTTADLIASTKNELDDDIKTNTDLIVSNKGALDDDIKSNTDLITSNSSGIAALLTATGTDASEISINLASIDKNTADIKTNNDLLISNKSALDDDIKSNTDLIVLNRSELDDDINTNTDLIVSNKGALDDDIKSNTDMIVSNKSNLDDDIKTNNDLIITNSSGIASNVAAITENSSGIASNLSSIGTNTSGIASLITAISTDATEISINLSSIATNTTSIAQNTSGVGLNLASIGTNTSGISSNVSSITTNTASIAQNSSDVGLNLAAIGTNTSGVALNLASITQNTSGVASNLASIATNAGSIGTNAGNIAQKCPIVAGKIPSEYLPPLAVTNVYVYATHQDVLDSVAEEGDVAICQENSLTYIYDRFGVWQTITAVGAVSTVNGFTGSILLTTADIVVSDADHRYFTSADQLDIHANEAAAQGNASSIETIETAFAAYRVANDAVLSTNSSTVDQYIESNDTEMTDYITANDGVVLANASTMDQYIASNNTAFADYVLSNDSAVNVNLLAIQNYIDLNNDAVNDIEVNARAGIDEAALIGDQALQIAQSAASTANNNSSTVDDYILSNNTVVNTTASTVDSYIASNNTAIADYIAANDALVAANSSTVDQYIASNNAAIVDYIAANDGVVLANALTVDQYVASNNTAFADYVSSNDSAVNDNVLALQNYIDLNNDAVNSLGVNARAGIDETALIGDQALQLAQSASTAASNAQNRADSAYSETTSNRALTVEYYGLSSDASTLAYDLAQQAREEGAVVNGLAQQAQQRADSAYGETTSNRALTVEYYGLAIDASTLAHNLANTARGEAAVVSGLAQQAQQSADTNLSNFNQYVDSNNALIASNQSANVSAIQANATQVSAVEDSVKLYTDEAVNSHASVVAGYRNLDQAVSDADALKLSDYIVLNDDIQHGQVFAIGQTQVAVQENKVALDAYIVYNDDIQHGQVYAIGQTQLAVADNTTLITDLTASTQQDTADTRNYISVLSTHDIEEPHNVGDPGYGENLYFTPQRQLQVQESTNAVAVIALSAKQGMELNTSLVNTNKGIYDVNKTSTDGLIATLEVQTQNLTATSTETRIVSALKVNNVTQDTTASSFGSANSGLQTSITHSGTVNSFQTLGNDILTPWNSAFNLEQGNPGFQSTSGRFSFTIVTSGYYKISAFSCQGFQAGSGTLFMKVYIDATATNIKSRYTQAATGNMVFAATGIKYCAIGQVVSMKVASSTPNISVWVYGTSLTLEKMQNSV
jgi:hypothetical protein